MAVDDPFFWDIDRLIEELLTAGRLPPALAGKLPGDVALQLRESGADGECLLVFEDVEGKANLVDFVVNQLALKKLPQRLNFQKIIRHLQNRSPGYLAWKQEWMTARAVREKSESDMDVESMKSGTRQSGMLLMAPATESATSEQASTTATGLSESGLDTMMTGSENHELAVDSQQTTALPVLVEKPPELALGLPPKPLEDVTATEGPPRKKKRLAPTNISAVPTHSISQPIATEGDRFEDPNLTVQAKEHKGKVENTDVGTVEQYLVNQASTGGYLGPCPLDPKEITRRPCTKMTSFEPTGFTFVRSKQMPPGRQIQINQTLKRYFLSSVEQQRAADSGDSDDDDVLPLFGESDDEVEIDSKTWREMEKDAREVQAYMDRQDAKRNTTLSQSDVERVVQQTIDDFDARWTEFKKPKLDHTANKFWNEARLSGARLHLVGRAIKTCENLERRLTKLKNGIYDLEWHTKTDIERQAANLEQTIFSRAENRWVINLLQSPLQPPRCVGPPSLRKPKKEEVMQLDEDEELLTSESSDLENFVVDDEQGDFSEHARLEQTSPVMEALQPSEGMDIDTDNVGTDDAGQATGTTNGCALLTSESDGELDVDGKPAFNKSDVGTPAAQICVFKTSVAPTDPVNRLLFPTSSESQSKRLEQDDLTTPAKQRTTEIIDLVTPSPPNSATLQSLPELRDHAELAEMGLERWDRDHEKDPERLIAAILSTWSGTKRDLIFEAVKKCASSHLWDEFILKRTLRSEQQPTASSTTKDAYLCALGHSLAQLFHAYVKCSPSQLGNKQLLARSRKRIRENEHKFAPFCEFVRKIAQFFPPTTEPTVDFDHLAASPSEGEAEQSTPGMLEEESSDDKPRGSARKKRRGRPQVQDFEAARMRLSAQNQTEEFEKRRLQLRATLASTSVPKDRERLIINMSKEADEGLILVSDNVAGRIKDHQVEGVRFMWDEIVASKTNRQGCLLAHTMGLGKTMQVITLLVAIAEAAADPDPAISKQIPQDLKQSKTLVLCPSGLVNNWVDEFLIWAPENLLGGLSKIDSTMDFDARAEMARTWGSAGGVLIMGYPIFRSLVRKCQASRRVLLNAPNIVVGDEAHNLKNPVSHIHRATSNFRTLSRIAMTGSPLTNDLMDYYAMINWVAPGFLSDIVEFRSSYANPISDGLHCDSDRSQKRLALKLLSVLKTTVAPKVHRRGIASLGSDMPVKREFIISVPLTPVQRTAYEAYIRHMNGNPNVRAQASTQTQIWSFVSILSTLLAHPLVFGEQLQERQRDQTKRAEQARLAGNDADGIEMPKAMIADILPLVSSARTNADYSLSNKVLILMGILDESKKVGDKVLIFSQSIRTLDFLQELFRRQKRFYFRLDGSTKPSARQAAVKDFNTEDKAEVYLISTRAGGVGLNIYGANRVVVFDFKFTPAEEQQAVGRSYRIGQTKPVFVYWLICGGTFESTIQNKSVFKMQLASRVVDKKNPIAWAKRLGAYFNVPEDPPQQDLSARLGQDAVLDSLLCNPEFKGIIRQIGSTDTFEEEDMAVLTADEEKEVIGLIEIAQKRLLGKPQSALLSRASHLNTGEAGQSNSAASDIQPASSSAPMAIVSGKQRAHAEETIKILVPEHMRSQRPLAIPSVVTPVPPPTIPNSGPVSRPPAAVSSADDFDDTEPANLPPCPAFDHRAVPGGPRARAAESLLPPLRLPGAVSGSRQSPPSQEVSHHAPSMPPSVSKPSESPMKPTTVAQSTIETWSMKLLQTLTSIWERTQTETKNTPHNITTSIIQRLDEAGKIGVPRMDLLQSLEKNARESQRFGEAMLVGLKSPAEICAMTVKNMADYAKELDSKSDEDFKSLRTGAINVGNSHLGNSSDQIN